MDTKVEKSLTRRIMTIAFSTAFCVLVLSLILLLAAHYIFGGLAFLLQKTLWYVTFPITILLLVIALKKNKRRLKTCCYCWFIVLYLSFPALKIGEDIAFKRHYEYRKQGRQIAKLIEDYRSEFGRYPDSLEDLKKLNEDIIIPAHVYTYTYNLFYDDFSLQMRKPYFGSLFEYDPQNDQWNPIMDRDR